MIELVIALALLGLISTAFFTLFNSTFFGYLDLQKQASSTTQLSVQTARLSDVLRSLISIELAKDNELKIYAYFYPSDAYTSRIHYYLVTNGAYRQLKADLTPMDGNPPTGQLLTNQTKTYSLVDNYYLPAGKTLFTYYNGFNAQLTTPITDFGAVKSIAIQLAAKNDGHPDEQMNLQVTLRNRKTNL